MAKKQQSATESAKNGTLARIKRTEAYAEQVRTLFARCVNEILALKKTLPVLKDGEMYSFDGDSLRIQKQVEELLRRLSAAATMAIENGVSVEWEQANREADSLLQTCFGKRATYDSRFRAWRQHNGDAMKAFQKRTDDGGMRLSDKIWKSARQLREEMEIAMTLGIGEGESAADMSRKVRKYLNDPDLMFRRFRYKAGEREVIDRDAEGNPVGSHMETVWGRKWKKKVKDENGRTRWIDYDKDDYKVGRGNYKSSARNAMRVTRTETNMAYRTADQKRWSQMDFVLGIHIEPSRSHPKKDICDKLAGDYPKDFNFEGWHPQCFCVMTPILMSEDEMAKVTEAAIKGETYTPKGKRITTYPQGFKDWVTAHKEDIIAAHDVNADPYFVKHNYDVVKKIWKPKPSALEIAEARHAARTDDEVKRITERAQERQKAIKSGSTMLNDMQGISDVDTAALEDAMAHAKWGQVEHLVAELNKIKQELLALDRLEDPLAAAKQFSVADAKLVQQNVNRTLSKFAHLPLSDRKAKLEFEIQWVEDNKKYPTWKVAQDAYKKELRAVERQLEVQTITNEVTVAINFAMTWNDTTLKRLASEMQTMLADPNVTLETIKAKKPALMAKYNEQHALYLKRETEIADVKTSVSEAINFAATTTDKTLQKLALEMYTLLGDPQVGIATLKAKATALNEKYKEVYEEWRKSLGESKTLAELKATMGDAMPKTLKNLQGHITRQEKSMGWTDEERQEVRDKMLNLFEHSDFGMNVPRVGSDGGDVLKALFSSHFKTQIETGTGKGWVNVDGRKRASKDLFGTDMATTQPHEYEKYGFLMDKDILKQYNSGIARQYMSRGDGVQIRFKKDKVVATFTMQDSLNSGRKPSLTTDPRCTSFDDYQKSSFIGEKPLTSAVEATGKWASSYIELQYHGMLTLDCIESIFIPADVLTKIPQTTLALMKQTGAKIWTESAGVLTEVK